MVCLQCKSEASPFQCSRCHRAHYCSRKCQKEHYYVTHKKTCLEYSNKLKQIADTVDIEDICKVVFQKEHADSAECRCTACAKLCSYIPGNYSPWQFELPLESDTKEVQTLKQTKLNKVFETSIQSYYPPQEEVNNHKPTVFFLRPKQVQEAHLARMKIPVDGACIHLGPAGCTLKRDQMPLGCTSVYGCQISKKSYLSGVPIEVAWGSKHGRNVMQCFETFQRSRKMPVGHDAVFHHDCKLFRAAAVLASALLEQDKTSTPLHAIGKFLQLKPLLNSLNAADLENVKMFAAKTYSLAKSRLLHEDTKTSKGEGRGIK